VLADAEGPQRDALFQFGQAVGVACQVADDALDYAAQREALGKLIGKDLDQGNVTLPLLHLKKYCTDLERQRLSELLRSQDDVDAKLAWIMTLMERYGSIDYALATARRYVEDGKVYLEAFEDSVYKRALHSVADYMVARNH
jgi:octaprenyl-diphosphate synthase